MTTNEFITLAENEFAAAFPDLAVRLIADPDDDSTLFAYMFRVPDGQEQPYKLRARELIRAKLKQFAEWRVIPSVKSMSVTLEHYPKYANLPDPMNGVVPNAEIIPLVICSSSERKPYIHLLDVMADDDYIDYDIPEVAPAHQVTHESEFRLAA